MSDTGGSGTAKPVNLALQGGGSHGAFTWGVLDCLLEDGRLDIAAVSGTSAGAMNAVALADGSVRGGRDGARERLEHFWNAVAKVGRFSPVQRTPFDRLFGNWSIENAPGYLWFEAMTRMFSPYETNPFGINPLREVVQAEIDFGNVRACGAFALHVSATNVHTGKGRVFTGQEVTLDAVMASACLPTLFRAVEIDGVPYWDGGYAGNPVIYPFFQEQATEDCILVQINPVDRPSTPRTAREIENRLNEITFNAALLREFRAIEFVRRLIADGRLAGTSYRAIRMHRIGSDELMNTLDASSKINAERDFLLHLRELGRAAAQDFLEENFDAIGERATLDLSEELAPDILPDRPQSGTGRRVRALMDRFHLR